MKATLNPNLPPPKQDWQRSSVVLGRPGPASPGQHGWIELILTQLNEVASLVSTMKDSSLFNSSNVQEKGCGWF